MFVQTAKNAARTMKMLKAASKAKTAKKAATAAKAAKATLPSKYATAPSAVKEYLLKSEAIRKSGKTPPPSSPKLTAEWLRWEESTKKTAKAKTTAPKAKATTPKPKLK
jgi:hypothetical protein